MTVDENLLKRLEEILENSNGNIVLVGHFNPDGDAIGAMLALERVLSINRGFNVTCVIPNKYPSFLEWMPGIGNILIAKEHAQQVKDSVGKADVIFSLDFNQIHRLEGLGEAIEANTGASKILVDHHLSPPEIYDVAFSSPEASSTCYLLYNIIVALYGKDVIDRQSAELLYVGMMTDTGNFSFSNLSSDLYYTIAHLVGCGIDIPAINVAVYNSFSEGRIRLLGYSINNKMEIIRPQGVAYISLKDYELRRFDFQQGDSEGFVNYPLSIKGIKMSAMFIQNRNFIRISLRSRGDVDVNQFARKYFDGGGHKNASGGKSMMSMDQTIEKFKQAVKEFFGADN